MARRSATTETSPADPIAQGPDGQFRPGDMVYYWESFGPEEIRRFPAMLLVQNPDDTWQINVHKPGLVRRGTAVKFADKPTLGHLTLRD